MTINYFQGRFINVIPSLVNSCLIVLKQTKVYNSYVVFLFPFSLICFYVLLIRTRTFLLLSLFVSYFCIHISNATPKNKYLKCKVKSPNVCSEKDPLPNPLLSYSLKAEFLSELYQPFASESPGILFNSVNSWGSTPDLLSQNHWDAIPQVVIKYTKISRPLVWQYFPKKTLWMWMSWWMCFRINSEDTFATRRKWWIDAREITN